MNSTKISTIRKDKDIAKLVLSDYDVTVDEKSHLKEMQVVFKGPKDSPYEEVNYKY